MSSNTDSLRTAALDSKPIDADWSELEYPEDFEYWEAVRCETCMDNGVAPDDAIVVGSECEECGSETYVEGPMMSYYYPVDIDDPYEAARQIVDLPLCVVRVREQYGLALTGGGMDLSWDICDAFILLGYLPPWHFCSLPEYAGMKYDEQAKRILDACKRSTQIGINWRKNELDALLVLENRLRNNG